MSTHTTLFCSFLTVRLHVRSVHVSREHQHAPGQGAQDLRGLKKTCMTCLRLTYFTLTYKCSIRPVSHSTPLQKILPSVLYDFGILWRPPLCPVQIYPFFHRRRLISVLKALVSCHNALRTELLEITITKRVLQSSFQQTLNRKKGIKKFNFPIFWASLTLFCVYFSICSYCANFAHFCSSDSFFCLIIGSSASSACVEAYLKSGNLGETSRRIQNMNLKHL